MQTLIPGRVTPWNNPAQIDASGNITTPGGVTATRAISGGSILAAGQPEYDVHVLYAGIPLVKGDGVTDDGASLNAIALLARAVGGILRFHAGVSYATSVTVTIQSHCDGRGATIVPIGTLNPAVDVCYLTGTHQLFGATVWLPNVVQAAQSWTVGGGATYPDTGVTLTNVYQSEIHVANIRNFGIGLQLRSNSGSNCAYNDIHLLHLENNKINLDFLPGSGVGDTGSCTNENTFYGGRASHFSANWINNGNQPVVGARHIRMGYAASQTNNNRIIGLSIEYDVPEYHLDCYGELNYFCWLRWETTAVSPKVHWGTNLGVSATKNLVLGGANADAIVETTDVGCTQNAIWLAAGPRIGQHYPITEDANAAIAAYETTSHRLLWGYSPVSGVVVVAPQNQIDNPSCATDTSTISAISSAALTRITTGTAPGQTTGLQVDTPGSVALEGCAYAGRTGLGLATGTSVSGGVWLKGNAGGEQVSLILRVTNTDTTTTNVNSVALTLTTAWTWYSLSGVVATGKTGDQISVQLRTTIQAAYRFFADDCSGVIGPQPSATNNAVRAGQLTVAGALSAWNHALPTSQPVMGAATAGASYGANEQTMLQAVYNMARAYGLGT